MEINVRSLSIVFETRIYIKSGGEIVGSKGLIAILEAISDKGSINKAAKSLNINYKRVWLRISRAEKLLGRKLLLRKLGRKGVELTEYGKQIIKSYRALEDMLKKNLPSSM